MCVATYILQLYYDELSRLVAERDRGRRLDFTLEALRPVYEISLAHQLQAFVMMTPLIANVG